MDMKKSLRIEEEEPIKVLDPQTGDEVPVDQFAVRLTKKEQVRYANVLALAFSRNRYVDKTTVNRMLLGHITDHNVVTDQEIRYFQGAAAPPTIVANTPEASQSTEANETHATTKITKKRGRA